jgi:ribosomal protein S18 acetylase RimI-like enzyme
MIDIQVLTTLAEIDLLQVMSGYNSHERYAVSVEETEPLTTFQLRLERLSQPYTRDFRSGLTLGDIQRYLQLLPQGLCLAAWVDGQVAGIAIAGAEIWNGTLWIWEFHVAPAFQRMGVGRRLMDTLAQLARARGLRTLRVETQNTNVPAIRFYRSLGFHLEGIDVSFYSNDDLTSGEVALFLKRRLD